MSADEETMIRLRADYDQNWRALEDDRQAAYLADHPDGEAWEWPLILLGALGLVLILVWACYELAAWWATRR